MTDKTDRELEIVFVRWEQEGAKFGFPLSDAINDVKQICIESDEARDYWQKHDEGSMARLTLSEPEDVLRLHFIEQACEAIRSQEVSKTFANDDYIEEWNMALESAEQAIRDRFNAASD